MVENKRETVIVEGDRGGRSSLGWVIGVIVILLLLVLFFMYGGFSLFSGGGAQGGDSVNVQPTTGQ